MENRLKVLVVEDDPSIAESLSDILDLLGHEVLSVAESGEEAILQLCEEEPQIILLDIQLKGKMDGIEVAKLVKDKFNIPFIFTTAFADPNTIQRAIQEGPFGYIVKPYGINDITAAIEVAITNHRLLSTIHKESITAPMLVNDQLYIKVEGVLTRLHQNEIDYVEAKGDYILIRTKEQNHIVYSSLKKIQEKLNVDSFLLVHRSFIVNLNSIVSIKESTLIINNKEIPISRSHRAELLKKLNTL
ncbi:MAG: DNA-binding response regulator [Bacteroidetes bacterium]|nr:MAG: DNA-binding response regulator [Bacteroidota bacterium]